jgi:hypothetical protein
LDRCIVLAEPQIVEDRLQQLDADPAVLGIGHHAQNDIVPQAIGECFHTQRRIGEVVQHAGRDDQVEIESQSRQRLDREQMRRQVRQPVFFLEVLQMLQ